MKARLSAAALALVWSGIVLAGCTERPTEPLATTKPLADVGPLAVIVPVANAGPDTSTYVGVPVRLGGTATDGLGRPIVSWKWRIVWGPGGGTLSDSLSDTTDFTGDVVGAYYVQLTACVPGTAGIGVMNNVDLVCSLPDEVQVILVNRAPTAIATADKTTIEAGGTVCFDGSQSVDPDNQTLSYSWNFGDGTDPSELVSPCHPFSTAGVFTVVLTVSDGSLQKDAKISITVEEPPDPRDGIVSLIDEIKSLVKSGQLSQDRGDGLLSKLNAALTSLDNGLTRDACKQLSAFEKQVTSSIRARKLDATIGQSMIEAAEGVRALIVCG